VTAYRRCAAIVGNSSSIVIESGFLRVPGVLVGPRQDLRETGPNVIRVQISADAVREACLRCIEDQEFKEMAKHVPSIYGDGHSCERIASILGEVPLDKELLRKMMPY
jgi:GDP/UDP-N,N'-diacetylbacillosamine 2-epimerase (hydrolysing)